MIFVERFWKSLAKSDECDVKLVIEFDEHEVKFPCHRHVLSKASDVFKKKLSNKLNNTLLVKIEPHIMFLILCYIYDEKFDPIDWETTVDVFLASESYEITHLYEHCVRLFLGFLDLSNACTMLELASTRSIPELHAASLALCVDAAFHVLDSEDFDNALPSTVAEIVAHADVNVPSETYVLYALWMRATVDVCRNANDLELTYANVAEHFAAYSAFVQYEDVDKIELAKYENEYLMRYYIAQMNNITPGKRIYPVTRCMKFPLKIPSRFYDIYRSEDIVSMGSLSSQTSIVFEIPKNAYLIEFRMACSYKANVSYNGITNLVLFENESPLIGWNAEENNNNSKLGLTVGEGMAYTVQGDVPFQEFRFVLEDLVKLCRSKTYSIKIESTSPDLMWPAFKNKFASDCAITIQTNAYQCLTQMKLLQCPSY